MNLGIPSIPKLLAQLYPGMEGVHDFYTGA
jgi:hypothetical protein